MIGNSRRFISSKNSSVNIRSLESVVPGPLGASAMDHGLYAGLDSTHVS
jgi:hypothetical protein